MTENAPFLEYRGSDLIHISTFSPFVHNNELVQAAYLIERQEISFVSDEAIIVGSCDDEPCKVSLDFTFQRVSYAKSILGHALAFGLHCKSIPVKHPVCCQTSCNGSYFVPIEFLDDNEVVESSIKNSSLYALTVLIICLGCCGICGLIFT